MPQGVTLSEAKPCALCLLGERLDLGLGLCDGPLDGCQPLALGRCCCDHETVKRRPGSAELGLIGCERPEEA